MASHVASLIGKDRILLGVYPNDHLRVKQIPPFGHTLQSQKP